MVLKRKRPPPPLAYCTDSSGKSGNGLTAIYVLCADGGDPRYVGQTVRPRQRMSEHLKCDDGSYRARWIQSVLRSRLPLHMEIVDWTEDPDRLEREWIFALRSNGCRLTNCTDGGDVVGPATYPGIRAARHIGNVGHPDYPNLREVIDLAVERASEEGPLALMTLDRDFAVIASRGRHRGWL